MKPQLPEVIRLALPKEIVQYIYTFVPHLERTKTPSPSLQKELKRIQTLTLKGKSPMYMKDFEDFCLD